MISFLVFALLQVQLPAFLKEDPDRAGVNTHPYEFHEIVDTPAPKGYKPVYISHYGRHGSRSDWGAKNYTYVIDILEKAEAQGLLTPEGDTLLNAARTVLDVHHGADGHLTGLGELEHRRLASRMYDRYPEVFKKGCGHIRVESSTVHRCLVSMADFTGELVRRQPGLDFKIDSDEIIMQHINNGCSPEHHKRSAVLLDSLRRSVHVDTVSIMKTLFVDPVAARALTGDLDRLQAKIWSVARIARSSGIDIDLYSYLPDDVVLKWWDYYNRELYIRHGNSVEFGEERMTLAESMVRDIVAKADEVLETGAYAADLKFGHDYPILALAGFLDLEGVGERMTFDEIPVRWTDPMNVPFAANMQLVFYRSRKSPEVLVKCVYGDKERRISDLSPVSGPYYRWNDVKAFIESRMSGK